MRRFIVILVTAFLAVGSLQTPAQAAVTSYLTPNILADLNPHAAGDEMSGAVEWNGSLYYGGDSVRYGRELRRITAAGISELVYDINPEGSSWPYALKVFKGKLYFYASNQGGSISLYSLSTSGVLTEHGAITDRYNFVNSSTITVYNNKLYMLRLNQNGPESGWQLWQFDGTNFALTPVPSHDRQIGLNSQWLSVVNNKLYFSMPTTADGYATALGVIGTNGIAVRAPGTDNITNPEQIVAFGNKIAMRALGSIGTEVYIYNGTSAPVGMNVADDTSQISNSWPGDLFVYKSKLYFVASQNSPTFEIWRTDGISQPSRFTGSLFTAEDGVGTFRQLAVFNGRMYFLAHPQGEPQWVTGLFSTDGTLIRRETALPKISAPFDMRQVLFGGKLYLNADIGTGYRLYAFDGVAVKEVEHSDYSTADGFAEPWSFSSYATTSNAFYFAADVGGLGGVYRFNGTTTPVLVPGSQNLYIGSLFNIGEKVYASAESRNSSFQSLAMYEINADGDFEKLDNLSEALGEDTLDLATPMGAGNLFVAYQNIVYVANNQITKLDVSGFSQLEVGVVIDGYYYFSVYEGSGRKVYRWDGVNAPTLYSDFGLDLYATSKLLNVNGELHCFADFGNGIGLYKVTQAGSEFIDMESGIDSIWISDVVKLGSSTYINSYHDASGSRRVWKLTSSEISAVPSVSAHLDAVETLSMALGRLVVMGRSGSGIFQAVVVESDGNVSTLLNTNVAEYEVIWGRVAGFNGAYYFPYNHPEFGLEMATSGSGVSADAPSAPTNLSTGVATDSSVALSWTAPTNSGGQPLSTYVVEYSTNGTTWKNFYHPASTATSLVVSGLNFNTTYQFRVKARTVEGNSAASSTASKKTLIVRPSAVRSVQVKSTGITKSTAKVTWLAPSVRGSGRITDYKVETSTNGKKWTVIKRKASTALSITLAKLKSKTKYYVRVTVVSTAGNSAASTKLQFKTK